MSIDAQTQAFLARLAASAPPPPTALSIDEFRRALGSMAELDHDFEEVAQVHDVTLEPGVALRVYRPALEGARPAIVWVHGGSWVRGGVAATDHFLRILANRSDCVVVGVDYRLPPESPFPGPVEDVLTAVRWTATQATAIGVDADAVALGGESTGGNLAAAAALAARERGGPQVSHQLLLNPLLDATFASDAWRRLGQGYGLDRDALRWALGQYAPGIAPDDPRLSPLWAGDLSGLPPALIVTGGLDPLGDDGSRYAVALEDAGVRVRHVRYDGLIHHAIVAPKAIGLGSRVLEETAMAIGAWVADD